MPNDVNSFNPSASFSNTSGLVNGQVNGSAGPLPFQVSDSDSGSESPDADRYDLDKLLQDRGLESLRHDSSRTHEDIKALVENIRPDEDLPPELREGTPPDLAVRLMTHQSLGLGWLKKQEEGSNRGGILADDMGLGMRKHVVRSFETSTKGAI